MAGWIKPAVLGLVGGLLAVGLALAGQARATTALPHAASVTAKTAP